MMRPVSLRRTATLSGLACFSLALAALAPSCSSKPPVTPSCSKDDDCTAGQHCASGTCVTNDQGTDAARW